MAVTLTSVDGTWINVASYDAWEIRRADAALVSSAGVSSGLAVSVDGSDLVTVTAGQAIISAEDAVAGAGVYRVGIGAAVSGTLEPRDATNGRIDLVVFRQYDTDVVGSHPRYKTEIEIIKGTPSATPAVPTKPSMAIELARITVPVSGGGAASVNSANRVSAKAVGVTPDPAAAGSVNVTVTTANALTSQTVALPAGRFSGSPIAVGTATNSSVTGVWITVQSATQITVYVKASATGTYAVQWIARMAG